MLPSRRLAALQSDIIDGAKRADDTLRDEDLAAMMGVDRTLVSRYRAGERGLRVDELAGLLRGGCDPVAVLGPLARIGGAEVHVGPVAADGDPLLASFDAADLITEVQRRLARAQSDGRVSVDESRDIHAPLEAAMRKLRDVSARTLRVAK